MVKSIFTLSLIVLTSLGLSAQTKKSSNKLNSKKMANIQFHGGDVHTNGQLPELGSKLADFQLVNQKLETKSLSDYSGKKMVLNIFPSIDTGVCATSARKFNEEAANLDNTVVLNISKDLPFALGRFCAFGNLFAKMGIGSEGKIYRLDRHPSMSKHPVTPADESDLRLHLGKQTNKKFGLVDILQLGKPVKEWDKSIARDEQVVLIDALYESQLENIGEWISSFNKRKIQFSVGGSGVEAALGKYWNKMRVLKPKTKWRNIQKAKPLLVLSGSCSPVTKKQIQYALAKGFVEVSLFKEEFNGETGNGFFIGSDVEAIIAALKKGKNVIVHSGNLVDIEQSDSARVIGKALGDIAKEVCKKIKLKRIVVAGGDTSSYAARAMEIDAVEMIAPVVIGAPLCKAYSKNKMIDGLEVNFKGGQVGGENYFGLF